MAASREVIYLNDFSGGLNLTEQQQLLAENESPDCLNVDFNHRGGFAVRGGFRSQRNDAEAITDHLGNVITDELGQPLLESGTGVWFTPRGILGATYFDEDVVLFLDTAGNLIEWDGGTATDTTETITDDLDAQMQMAVFNSTAYLANGRDTGDIIMQSWDGTTLTVLGNDFNDTAGVVGGDMPLARLIASHKNHLWVADTVESATRFPHRVRWSWIGEPEDWRTDEYFDIDTSDDSDPVTALVPFRDMLLIFKRSSLWIVTGDDSESFVLSRVETASGTDSWLHVDANSGIVYWLDVNGQLMAFNGRDVGFIGEKIFWWVQKGRIDPKGDHRLMWAENRLWISMEAGTASEERYLFVWEPTIKAFTRYSFLPTDMIWWKRLDDEADILFIRNIDPNIYRFDVAYETDQFGSDTIVRIDAHYRTAWVTAGETATRKRWKRPRVTAAGQDDLTVRVRVFHDFDEWNHDRQQEFTIVRPPDSLWGVMVWGDPWAVDQDEIYEFQRLGSSGTAYAVQYEFSSPDSLTRWWVDSVAIPFRRKQVK